ncbi:MULTISPECIES: glycosyltransferase family 1 protein [unclassified Massilia]|uniref:glycosyltransferase family 4 protein n=1 Tax=unclassified Massilia TaxID=2609279 RepID=UPI001784383C|nr:MULTISPECIES: glycosyltransferase family 1 protein [unclassified Massilia]MBD8529896.1 glycosyltransferase family 4 protein [Massilia sp. CFBP 13647]MBD8672092.1 glycosyltransferase family 4 protein [Massilia sp. CFBP 13721]
MRIVIDLQAAQTASRFRGIGRYATALARAMLRNAGPHEIWLVLNAALEDSIGALRADFDGLLPQERIRVFETPGRVAETDPNAAPRTRAAEMLREEFIARLAPDVVLVTSLFEGYLDDAVASVGTFIGGARTAVILYDLIPLLNPDSYLGTPDLRQFYMRKIDSLRRAGLLLSISDYARTEAIGALGLAPQRVVAISSAVDEVFAPGSATAAQLAALCRRVGIVRPFVMCAPGGYEARKNLAGLLAAYALLPEQVRAGHQLVVASRLSDAQRRELEDHAARHGVTADELVLTGYVSDAELVALYGVATLFVLPSLHEGFGLPALEAMACGAAVIGSNSTSIPEVIGLDEALFDPACPRAIAARMEAVLVDPALRERLRTHGRAQARKFSWDQTARRALRALEQHTATSAALAPRGSEALVEALAALPGLRADASTLVQLALCFAAMPDLAAPRRLLLDLGALQEIPHADAQGMHGVALVSVVLNARGGPWHHRHAPAPGASGAGAVADIRTGDVLLTLGGTSATLAAACADGLYAHLVRLGVRLVFFVGDGACPLPRADDAGWIGALPAEVDAFLCTTGEVAATVRALRAPLPHTRRAGVVAALDDGACGDARARAVDWVCAALARAS